MRRFREKILAEKRPQVRACLRGRALGHARGIRAHVGDETDGALVADVDSLVQILRDAHRPLGPEGELLRRLLLQRRRRERRRGVLATLATLDLRDLERPATFEIVDDALRLGLVVDLRFLAIDVMELGREGLLVLLEQRLDRPVLHRRERADLALALDDEPQGHGLHAAGGESLLHRLP